RSATVPERPVAARSHHAGRRKGRRSTSDTLRLVLRTQPRSGSGDGLLRPCRAWPSCWGKPGPSGRAITLWAFSPARSYARVSCPRLTVDLKLLSAVLLSSILFLRTLRHHLSNRFDGMKGQLQDARNEKVGLGFGMTQGAGKFVFEELGHGPKDLAEHE